MSALEGNPEGRWLSVEEVRVVSDLRIMHAKVNELYEIVSTLRSRYSEAEIHAYSDAPLLSQNIDRIDEIYLWFVKLREQRDLKNGTQR
ncbi:MAG: hypothetical protein ACRD3E_00475 [Terriglobales bacterium]